MDRFALIAANYLVGNEQGAAVLETVFMGPELEFIDRATVAVTGAELPPKVNGRPVGTWTSFTVASGDVLSFDFLRHGARAYIAVSGGIDVPIVLGSRSTYTLGALGGFKGRKLESGDKLEVDNGKGTKAGRRVPEELRHLPGPAAELRMMPGLYWHRITAQSGKQFMEDVWKVAPEADRIEYRFKGGRSLEFNARTQAFGAGSDPSNIVDACYPYVVGFQQRF